MIHQVKAKHVLTVLISLICTASAYARHPWDCPIEGGEQANYCFGINLGEPKFCDRIEHEGMKFTCHARVRFDTNICLVIDNPKDRKYCLNLVRKEIKTREEYSKRVLQALPPEYRDRSAWSYPK